MPYTRIYRVNGLWHRLDYGAGMTWCGVGDLAATLPCLTIGEPQCRGVDPDPPAYLMCPVCFRALPPELDPDEVVNQVCYFWEEKGDLERCSSWPQYRVWLQQHHPEVLAAWENHKIAIKTLSACVSQMAANHPWEENS